MSQNRCGKCQNCCPRPNQPKLDCDVMKRRKRAEKKKKQRRNKRLRELKCNDIMNALQCSKEWANAVRCRIQGRGYFTGTFEPFFTKQIEYVDYPKNCSWEHMLHIDLENDLIWDDAVEPIFIMIDKDIEKLK